ncbi:MAG TPA: enolase C-terminal domain-like protein [Ramlibacter sp.]|nr:enolase C-terminal domain-like protein [Ramlibacter sp.]
MKLRSWSLHPCAIPYLRKVAWAGSEDAFNPVLVLKLVAEDGSIGVAEVAVKPTWFGTSMRSIVAALEDILLPLAATIDVSDESAFLAAAAPIPENVAAKAVVDNALWDLRAAIAGEPLWQRWRGDDAASVCWLLTRQSPVMMAREAAGAVDRHGFTAIKLKGGQGVEVDLHGVREVRSAVGPGVRIFVDTNSHYRPEDAAAYLDRMAEEGVVAVEDPYPMHPDAVFEAVQRDRLPIIVDAPAWSERDAGLFVGRGARALALKPGRSGLSVARAQAVLAAAAGARAHVGFGGETALGALSSLQLAASLPDRAQWLPSEVSYFLMMSEHLLISDLTVVDGRVAFPEFSSAASLVDWDKVARLAS